jgi:predicted exporter
MTRAGLASTLVWALLALIAAYIVARATYTADLSAFLPRRASATQRVLVEQLSEGPAAHLIIAAIEGGDARTRAQVSAALAARLDSDPAFAGVNNGNGAQLERDRRFLFEHRYALSPAVTPERFTAEGLHQAIADSLDVLASPEGLLVKPLFTRDPTGEMLTIIESLGATRVPHTSEGVWSSPDGQRALLLAQTSAAGSDIDGQQAACEALRRGFAAATAALPAAQRAGLRLQMSGPPVFAVASRATIKGEVWRLSCISAALITALLLAVYRSPSVLALSLVPVASGALAGVAAVALGFPAVHGITLGFGVTLIGEAVDYSIYLFIQRPSGFLYSVWPTIRLGVLTSICGFAALLPSSFPGLAQLGLYSIAGLIAAALVTRFVLPAWLSRAPAIRDLSGAGARLTRLLAKLRPGRAALLLVLLSAAAILYLHRGELWNRDLAALSPTPIAEQELDARLRSDAGAPDTRYLLVASAADREDALAAAEALSTRLTPLVDGGVIGGFESPARFLPSRAAQRARQASLPPPDELSERLRQALTGLPVSAARLQPFLRDVERARTASPLTNADLAGTSLGRVVDALLVRTAAGWSALLPVSAADSARLSASAVAQLRAAVAEAALPHAQLLDLKAEADQLYVRYLREAERLALVGLGAIVLLLLLTLRSVERVARVVAPLVLSVLATTALLVASGQKLTIMHIVGMLLIVAVGSNYALFFDRAGTRPREGSTPLRLASLAVANLATVIGFSVLACSSVPVLADLGLTVAPGTLLALLFAALLARPVILVPPDTAAALPSVTTPVGDDA